MHSSATGTQQASIVVGNDNMAWKGRKKHFLYCISSRQIDWYGGAPCLARSFSANNNDDDEIDAITIWWYIQVYILFDTNLSVAELHYIIHIV